MPLSQNKKIAASALAIFMVSFSALLFFLSNADPQLGQGHTNVLGATEDVDHKKESAFPFEFVDENCEECLEGKSSEDQNLFVISPEGNFLEVSETFCAFAGYECKILKGKSLFEYIDEKTLPKFTAYHSKTIQDGETRKGAGPYKFVTSGGETSLVLFDICPILGRKDKVEKIVIFIRDITETVKSINAPEKGGEDDLADDENETWLERVYPRQMADKLS